MTSELDPSVGDIVAELAELRLGEAVEVVAEPVDGLHLATSWTLGDSAVLKYNSMWANVTYVTLTRDLSAGGSLAAGLRGSKTHRPPKHNYFKDRRRAVSGLSHPNSALVSVSDGRYISCELMDEQALAPCGSASTHQGEWTPHYEGAARHPSTCRSLYCFVLEADPDLAAEGGGGVSLSRAAAHVLRIDAGYYAVGSTSSGARHVPETAQLANAGHERAVLCWIAEDWAPLDFQGSSKRRSLLRCRVLFSVGADAAAPSGLAVGPPFELRRDGYSLGLEEGVVDMSLASYDDHRVAICYGVADENRCALLRIGGEHDNELTLSQNMAGDPSALTIGKRPATAPLSPCRFSRLADSAVSETETAVVCCQRPTWLAWRDLQCTALDVLPSGQLRADGVFRPWRASTMVPWRAPMPLALVQLDQGKALFCYHWTSDEGRDLGEDEIVICEEIALSRPNYWWPHLSSKSRMSIEQVDSGRIGFFAVNALSGGEAIACYRNVGGTLSCRRLSPVYTDR